MSNLALRIENVGKQYQIGQGKTAAYETLGDRIVSTVQAPFKRIGSVLRGQSSAVATDSIWALRDVSFEVQHGEVVGIIGRNGAGKSTLLKILSQITEPTKGAIDIYGRVGALLEVGTGFHPELTGRENVFLNGAILGMNRHEIARKFDEIVDFSGIEKFIDTPVKHYSSGMQMRLAFAVAAHLDPEILIVDEVLAVGDAEFQKKCLGKMSDVTKEGRTVLFVSHNMAAVQSLCTRGVLLNSGRVELDAAADTVISAYMMGTRTTLTEHQPGIYDVSQRRGAGPTGQPIIQRIRLENAFGAPSDSFQMGNPMQIVAEVIGLDRITDAYLGVSFFSNGQRIATIGANMTGEVRVSQERHRQEEALLHVARIPFAPGVYTLNISIHALREGVLDYIENAVEIEVIAADVYGSGYQMQSRHGLVYIEGRFEIRPHGIENAADTLSTSV